MGRLTKHTPDNFGYAEYQLKHGVDEQSAISRLAAYEDIGMEPEKIKDFVSRWKDAVEIAGLCKAAGIARLRELAEADSKGLVRILPYSVLAYKIYSKRNRHGNVHRRVVECINYGFPESEIGKTVFLTREAAEAALKAGDCTHGQNA